MRGISPLGQQGPVQKFLEIENRRIKEGPHDDEDVQGLCVDNFIVQVRNNAELVIVRIKQVMLLMNEFGLNKTWPSIEMWQGLLPAWFVEKCDPERSPGENKRNYLEDRLLSWEDKVAKWEAEKYTVGDWELDMAPDVREWLWWDFKIRGPDTLLVAIDRLTDIYPEIPGEFEWLLTACGGEDIGSLDYAKENDFFPTKRKG